jgi:CRP/FNR family transcriptional regulator
MLNMMILPAHFKDIFEPGLLSEMTDKTERKIVKAGTSILGVGQIVRVMPIVLSGSISISRTDEEGREILMYYINPNESCAMTFTCCLEHFPSEIKAVAEDDTELLLVPVQLMDQWLAKYPTWKSFVMKTIRDRFNDLLKTIDQVAFQKLDERLVSYLKEKSRATGSTLINLSHEQIATELATSRVVISRLLKRLENDKKVLLYRNQVKLLNTL